jgi:hypothetical protein
MNQHQPSTCGNEHEVDHAKLVSYCPQPLTHLVCVTACVGLGVSVCVATGVGGARYGREGLVVAGKTGDQDSISKWLMTPCREGDSVSLDSRHTPWYTVRATLPLSAQETEACAFV